MHADELTVDTELARRLVETALPELADLDVSPLPTSGSSNTLFRLGDDFLLRFPRQPGGSGALEKERRWASHLARYLPVAVPTVHRLGDPALGYPERWALTGWLPGEVPQPGATHHRRLAADLAGLVDALRKAPIPAEAAADPSLTWYRSHPLVACADRFRDALAACSRLPDLDLDLARAADVWALAVQAESDLAPQPPTWVHADLLAENLLVRDGRLAAVLDLGGLAVGRSAVDLVVAWEVLDAAGRADFRRLLDVGDAAWAVGRGWAVLIALLTFPYYARSMPERCRHRRHMLAAALSG